MDFASYLNPSVSGTCHTIYAYECQVVPGGESGDVKGVALHKLVAADVLLAQGSHSVRFLVEEEEVTMRLGADLYTRHEVSRPSFLDLCGSCVGGDEGGGLGWKKKKISSNSIQLSN